MATNADSLEVKQKTQSTTGKVNHIDNTLDATDLVLEFFTNKEQGWPVNFITEELVKGIEKNKYKWKYNHASFSENQILREK